MLQKPVRIRCGRIFLLCGVAGAVVFAGCGPATTDRSGVRTDRSGVRTVLATTTVVADLVREVAGPHVEVDCLMGPGVDPHSYRATPRDAGRLEAAGLIVACGLHLEGKLAELLERLAERKPVVFAGEAVPADSLIPVAEQAVDPHVWFDPMLWRHAAKPVAVALGKIDPDHAADFAARAEAYAARLEEVDTRLRERLAAIDPVRRVLVTAHDAFGYFGRAYGVEVVGVQGVSTESEAGLADVNRLVALIVERGIPTVFVETSVSDRNVEAICEGVRARGGKVRVGGRLYSDALGEPGSGADTLVGMLEHNVRTIADGLVSP
jgi:manganese/zinc/iron transport system substrate-binding protein